MMAANSMNNSNQNIGNGIITDANNNMLNFPGMNSNLANLAALGMNLNPLINSRNTNAMVSMDECTDTETITTTVSRAANKAAQQMKQNGNGSNNSSANVNAIANVNEQSMSTEEKAKANRDRNREHARNTRLRKKAYLEKLKATVDELCKERDTLIQERANMAALTSESVSIRMEVLIGFLSLRSSPTQFGNKQAWATLISEADFKCVLPVTPYRSFCCSEVQMDCCVRTVVGIDALVNDCASLHLLLNSIAGYSGDDKAEFNYSLITEQNRTSSVSNGNQVMARWTLQTTNLKKLGANSEVSKSGMLYCKFNSHNKITHIEFMFDVMAFMLQLKNAMTSPFSNFSIVPNTLQTANIHASNLPMCITLATRPFTIVAVNNAWEQMTGYQANLVMNAHSPKLLQVPCNENAKKIEQIMTCILFRRCADIRNIVNTTKHSKRFRHSFNLFPLSSDSRITHYLSVSTDWAYFDE